MDSSPEEVEEHVETHSYRQQWPRYILIVLVFELAIGTGIAIYANQFNQKWMWIGQSLVLGAMFAALILIGMACCFFAAPLDIKKDISENEAIVDNVHSPQFSWTIA
jgi:hypothetical protein